MNITLEQADLLTNMMNSLPSDELFEYAKSRIPKKLWKQYENSHPILIEFFMKREVNSIFGILLTAKLLGVNTTVAWDTWKEGKIDVPQYCLVNARIDYYQAVFNLIQAGWRYLKIECKDSFNKLKVDDFLYFLSIIVEDFNQIYIDDIQGFQESLKDMEYQAVKARNALWENPSEGSWKNEEAISNLTNDPKYRVPTHKQCTFIFAINILEKYIKEDTVLFGKFTDLRMAMAKEKDLIAKICQQHRKARSESYMAEKWRATMPYKAVRGGWKPIFEP